MQFATIFNGAFDIMQDASYETFRKIFYSKCCVELAIHTLGITYAFAIRFLDFCLGPPMFSISLERYSAILFALLAVYFR